MEIQEARKDYVRWLATTKGLSSHTVRAYSGDVGVLADHLGPQSKVEGVIADDIVDLVRTLRSSGMSNTSIRRRIAGIRSFFQWLLASDLVEPESWFDVSLRIPVTRSLPRAVPEAELGLLLDHLCKAAGLQAGSVPEITFSRPESGTTLVAVGLMLVTGVRVSELVGITCPDLDLSNGTIRVTGKGSRERTVYLSGRWISQLCQVYVATREQLGPRHHFLLLNQAGGPLSSAAMRTRLTAAGRRAGLRRHITPHMLRHSAATQLLESGVDIRYVQRLLGHASITTTELYTHVTDRALRQMISDANVLEKCLVR